MNDVKGIENVKEELERFFEIYGIQRDVVETDIDSLNTYGKRELLKSILSRI